jgi:hypothetical protein
MVSRVHACRAVCEGAEEKNEQISNTEQRLEFEQNELLSHQHNRCSNLLGADPLFLLPLQKRHPQGDDYENMTPRN